MKGLKKRQITLWALLDLPERAHRKIGKKNNTSINEQRRPPDGLGYEKGPEVAPGRKNCLWAS